MRPQPLSILASFLLLYTMHAMEVYKLSLDSNVLHAGPAGYRMNLAFAQTPDTLFSGTSNYTISLWAKRNAFTNTDYTLFRIISSSNSNTGPGSASPLVVHNPTVTNAYSFRFIGASAPADPVTGVIPSTFDDLSYYVENRWTFFLCSVNLAGYVSFYVLSYDWNGVSLQENSYYYSLPVSSDAVPLSASAVIILGGEVGSLCDCSMAQARFYPKFSTTDQQFMRDFLSFDMSERRLTVNFGPFNGLNDQVLVHDPSRNTPYFFGVNGLNPSADAYDLIAQPYGDIECSGSGILSFNTITWHKGFFMKFWVKPTTSGTILSAQYAGGTDVFAVSVNSATGQLAIKRYTTSWSTFESPPNSITIGAWNEIIVGYPLRFGMPAVRGILIINQTNVYELGGMDDIDLNSEVFSLTFCAGYQTAGTPADLFTGTIRSWSLNLGYVNITSSQESNCLLSIGTVSSYCFTCNSSYWSNNGTCFPSCPEPSISVPSTTSCFSCNPNITGDLMGHCALSMSNSCLLYDPSNSVCSVCAPNHINDAGTCTTTCSNPAQVPLLRSSTCDAGQQLIAFIEGGDRSFPISSPLVLDASKSVYLTSPSTPLTYTWYCAKETSGGSCEYSDQVALNTPSSSPLLTIPANTYKKSESIITPIRKDVYTFMVRVSTGALQSFYSVSIQFCDCSDPLQIHYENPLYTYCLSNSYRFWISHDTPLSNVFWTATSTRLVKLNDTYVVSKPVGFEARSEYPVGLRAQFGQNYAEITFPLNLEAQDGNITVSPLTHGVPLQTVFVASAVNWTYPGGGALNYGFSYFLPNPNDANDNRYNFHNAYLISPPSSNPTVSFYLPNYDKLWIKLSVQDPTGCLTEFPQVIQLAKSFTNDIDELNKISNFASTIVASDMALGSLYLIASEIMNIDNLIDCKFNTLQNMEVCTSGNIEPRHPNPEFTCSGNGAWTNTSRCRCNKGYYLADCSMNETIFNQQLSIRQKLLDFTTQKVFQDTSVAIQKAGLSILDSLSAHAFLNTNQTLSQTLSSLNASLSVIQSYSPSDSVQPLIQLAANVLSNVMNATIEKDCGLTTNFSLQAINSTFQLLETLAGLSLRGITYNESTIETNNIFVSVQVVSKNSLETYRSRFNPSYPQVQLNSSVNDYALPDYIAVVYLYLKIDPTSCYDQPSANFVFMLRDASTFLPLQKKPPVKISYPNSNFACAPVCTQLTDGAGRVTCDCSDLGFFEIDSQLGRIYNVTYWNQLLLQKSTVKITNPVYKLWSFWTVLAINVLFLVAVTVLRRLKLRYCILDKLKRAEEAGRKANRCYKLLVTFAVWHPFSNIFMYHDPTLSKYLRMVLYYVRQHAVLCVAADFANKTMDTFDFNSEMQQWNFGMIALVFTIMPALSLLERLLRKRSTSLIENSNGEKAQEDERESTDAETQALIVCSALITTIGVGIIFLVLTMLAIARFHHYQQELWGVNYLKALLLDFIISPIFSFLINFTMLKFLGVHSSVTRRVQMCMIRVFDDTFVNLWHQLRWAARLDEMEENIRNPKKSKRPKKASESVIDLKTGTSLNESKLNLAENIEKHNRIVLRSQLSSESASGKSIEDESPQKLRGSLIDTKSNSMQSFNNRSEKCLVIDLEQEMTISTVKKL